MTMTGRVFCEEIEEIDGSALFDEMLEQLLDRALKIIER